MEKFLAEDKALKVVVAPVNLNTGVNTGNRVNIANAKRVAFVLNVGSASSATGHVIILKQHTAASGGTTADLSVANPIFHKVGAATEFTKVDVSSAVATNDMHSVMGDNAGLVIFEVLAEQLTDGYGWVSVVVNQPGVTQLGSVVAYVDHEFKPAYEQTV